MPTNFVFRISIFYRLPGLFVILSDTLSRAACPARCFTLIQGVSFSILAIWNLGYLQSCEGSGSQKSGPFYVPFQTYVMPPQFHGSEGVRITFQTIQREFAQSGSNRSPICYRSRRRAHLRQSAFLSPGPFEDALNVNYAVYIGSGRNYLFTS